MPASTSVAERSATSEFPPTAARHGLLERDLGLLAIRVVAGIVFIGHGGQKLFGWFNGPGLDGTATFFESSGFTPGKPLALLAGLAEFGGGILLILGLGTSFAAAALVGTMAGATAVKIDGADGKFFAMNSGYEYELLLTVLALGLVLTGAGRLALDHGRFWDRPTLRYGLAATGIVAGLVVVLTK